MSTTEIRVRPVVRHAVQRYVSEGRHGSSEMIGEFANEAFAEEVAAALQDRAKPRQYIVVERNFDMSARIGYADYARVAELLKEDLERETGKEFRVYSREATDPMVIARIGLQDEESAVRDYITMKCAGVGSQVARD